MSEHTNKPLPPQLSTPESVRQAEHILDCWDRLLGYPLCPVEPGRAAEALWRAPFVVLSHTAESDPRLNYANAMALDLWEAAPSELLGLPSRYTAEACERSARAGMLSSARQSRVIHNYEGIRISRQGRRFWIREATIWELHDEAGARTGQAAVFSRWEYL